MRMLYLSTNLKEMRGKSKCKVSLLSRLVVQELEGDQNNWNRVHKVRMKNDEDREVTVDQTQPCGASYL